ncbi:hypothetical protein BGZ72_007373 [Mortierella alpina]|nr:hypothetical protein BGZ72_007373 [Mortierella alpina]
MALTVSPSCSYCDSKQGGNSSGPLDDIDSIKTDALLCQQRMKNLRAMVPNLVRRRLNYHLDECWFVHFSPSGEFLASIGLDQTIALWHDMMSPEPCIYKTFNYKRTITQVEWSPNSKYLLANLGYDLRRPDFVPELHLISVETGKTLFAKSYYKNDQIVMVSSISWFSDSKRFLTATDDGLYCIWNADGKIIREIAVPKAIRAEHIRMIPGKDEALIYTRAHTLEHLSLGETVSAKRVDEVSGRTMAVNISRQGKYLALSSKVDEELHRPAQISLYDLKTMSYLRSFETETYINDVFMIVPAFAGYNEELLCAGSENGKLHFWDIETGEVVSVLDEHSNHSGCISVHPSQAGMAVSCSDDNTIIIWVTDELQRDLQAGDERWMQRLRGVVEPPLDIKNGW